jgi:hypothetical protein
VFEQHRRIEKGGVQLVLLTRLVRQRTNQVRIGDLADQLRRAFAENRLQFDEDSATIGDAFVLVDQQRGHRTRSLSDDLLCRCSIDRGRSAARNILSERHTN